MIRPTSKKDRMDKILHVALGIGLIWGLVFTGYGGALLTLSSVETPHNIIYDKQVSKEFSIPLFTGITGYSEISQKNNDFLAETVPYSIGSNSVKLVKGD